MVVLSLAHSARRENGCAQFSPDSRPRRASSCADSVCRPLPPNCTTEFQRRRPV